MEAGIYDAREAWIEPRFEERSWFRVLMSGRASSIDD